MPNKDTDSRLIYHHLSEIDRLADERERLDAQVREINVAWHHHVAAVEPHFEKLGGAAINVYNRVVWLDPVHGIRVKKLRPWIALVPDADPEPIKAATPPIVMPSAWVEQDADGRPVIISDPGVKPMSYAERQATQRYVPDPIDTDRRIDDVRRRLQAEAATLTDAQIDEGAEYGAEQDEPHMTDDEIDDLELAAMAMDPDDDSDLHAVRTLDGHTYLGGNGRAS